MDAAATVREALRELDVSFEESTPGTFVAVLPGERKLRTTVSLVVGPHSLTANAFVVRHPDENSDGVHRWLLQYNAKHPGVAFGIDQFGDVYVVAQLPLVAVKVAEVDQLLGRILDVADTSFNALLELGFAASIRREWAWRVSRGESLANLRAFAHLVDDDPRQP
ncbi:MAG: YbjN domain-containing protein [Actinomycetia bacterium]|nr:YbjN domain-containing protein [Actinomycetes bacterium]